MITTSYTHVLGSDFSAQFVITSSGRQCQMRVECSTTISRTATLSSYAFARTPTCLIESNAAFTTEMHYGGRKYPDKLPVVEYAGEYSSSFPLWADATVYIRCGSLRLVLQGSAVPQEVQG